MAVKTRRTAKRSPKSRSNTSRSKSSPRKQKSPVSGRKKSHFKTVSRPVKKRFSDRFQKFYYLHRDDLNRYRREQYKKSKRLGICVKCEKKRTGKSIFCAKHLHLSRVYNRR